MKKTIGETFWRTKWQFMLKNPSAFQKENEYWQKRMRYICTLGEYLKKGVPLFCEAVENAGVKAVVVGDGGLKKRFGKNFKKKVL